MRITKFQIWLGAILMVIGAGALYYQKQANQPQTSNSSVSSQSSTTKHAKKSTKAVINKPKSPRELHYNPQKCSNYLTNNSQPIRVAQVQ